MSERFIAYCEVCCWSASGPLEYRMDDKADAHTEQTKHPTNVIEDED